MSKKMIIILIVIENEFMWNNETLHIDALEKHCRAEWPMLAERLHLKPHQD